MSTDNTTTVDSKAQIETETCGRCGGCGQYSYCQRYGSTCFGCGGKGVRYTKRGQVAANYLTELLSKPVTALKPGDKVRQLAIAGGEIIGKVWEKVESVIPDDGSAAHFVDPVTGKPVIQPDTFILRTNRCTYSGVASTTLFRVAATAEEKAAALAKALEFQDTLTQQGKPRKARKGS